MRTVLRVVVCASALGLLGCDKRTVIGAPGAGDHDAGIGGMMAGPPDAGLGGGGGTTTGTGGNGGGGGGGGSDVGAPIDISGRWGMFEFEDPVGVQLGQAPDGTLTGRGCAAGAPGGPPTPGAIELFCGPISGRVTGRTASFAFPFEGAGGLGPYSARVTLSVDGSRMAGIFNNGAGDIDYPMAWLRVRDDADWLNRAPPIPGGDPLSGRYELALIPEASMGDEFVPARTYELRYFGGAIAGDLGSFWHSEMSAGTPGTPLRVGPVSPTASAIPTSLALDFDATVFTRVSATTASGGLYVFAATKVATLNR
jgi:hypothetical protein